MVNPPIWRYRGSMPSVALPNYPRDRRTIAHHEAAHAVLCCLFGVPIRGARVDADGSGKVDLEVARHVDADAPLPRNATELEAPAADADIPLPSDAIELAAIRLAVMYVGGVMAELLLHGLSVSGWLALYDSDWRNARAVLTEGFGHDLPLYDCQCVAGVALVEHWAWVSAVADELDLHGAITANDIRRLKSQRDAAGTAETAADTRILAQA